MKSTLTLLLSVVVFAFSAHAQDTNKVLANRIKELKAEKTITLTYNAKANSSKIMAQTDNFDSKEASKAGIQAMNFGMAFSYPGNELAAPPDEIALTFWVLTKQPRFAAANTWKVTLDGGTLDLGPARYTARPASGMEYLNFKITPSDLAKFALGSKAEFVLGNYKFAFTPAQLVILRNFLSIADSRSIPKKS